MPILPTITLLSLYYRYYSNHLPGVAAKEVYEGAANLLNLDDSQRNELIPSGQPVYKIGLVGSRPAQTYRAIPSKWCLSNPLFPGKAQVDHLAFGPTDHPCGCGYAG